MRLSLLSVHRTCLLLMLWLLAPAAAQAVDCNRAMRSAVELIELPGEPFAAVPSADGCTIFASLSSAAPGSSAGVAVLSRRDGRVSLQRIVPLAGSPGGLALTHDGKVLVVANGANVAFLDVQRLGGGKKNPVLGYWSEPHGASMQIYAVVTSDDHYVFVSNEAAGRIGVLDLAAMRRTRFRKLTAVATIAVGASPVGLALSADERHLFATSQSVQSRGWPKRCRREGSPQAPPDHTEGAIAVIDVARAVTGSENAVVKWVGAGCNPVRVAISPEGERVYVTARGSDTLLTFPSTGLMAPGVQPEPVKVPVGNAPVGLAVIDGGRQIVVTNSNRFGGQSPVGASLYVIDAGRPAGDSTALLGVLPAKGFPREIHSTADGQTLLVTNFTGRTLEILDLRRKPWAFAPSGAEPRDAWLIPDATHAFAAERWSEQGRQCCPVTLTASREIPGI